MSAQEFLGWWFAGAPAGSVYGLSWKPTTGSKLGHESLNSVEQLAARAAELDAAGVESVWFRVTTLREHPATGERGSADASGTLLGLWGDLDIAGPGHKEASTPRPADEDAARALVRNAGLPEPSAWVHTGGGLSPWWKLAEPLIIDSPEAFERAQKLSEAWQQQLIAANRGVKVDNVRDLARIMRLPGTTNRKVADQPRPCRVLGEIGASYVIGELETAIGAAAYTAPSAVAPVSVDDPYATSSSLGDAREWPVGPPAGSAEVVHRITQLRDELAAEEEGSGNTAAARLAFMAGQYAGAGQISQEETTDIMLSALDGWEFSRRKPRSEMETTIRNQVAEGMKVPRAWEAARKAEQQERGNEEESEGPSSSLSPVKAAVNDIMARLLDRDALDNVPPPTPLVERLLDLESESWIIGAPSSFKSFVALDVGCHVATGLEWRGRKVTRGLVVYIAAEGRKGIPQRVRAWEKTYGVRAAGVYFLPMPIQVLGERKGQLSVQWRALVEVVRRLGPVLIVIDTQSRVTVGLEENSNDQMGLFILGVTKLKEATGACVLVVHHTGRDGLNARGASAIDGAQDTELKVTKPKPKSLSGTIGQDKQKDSDDSETIKFRMVKVDLGTDTRTGRSLDSLALEPYDPFSTTQADEEEIPEWRANLGGARREVLEVMEHSGSVGFTIPSLERLIAEHRKHRDGDKAKKMGRSTLYEAVKALCGEGDDKISPAPLVRDGKDRVVLADPLDGMD